MLSLSAAPDWDVTAAGSLSHRVLRLYEQLRAQSDLAPSPVVNALFADLVDACVHADAEDVPSVLSDPRITGVRSDLIRLCAQGESLLENAWARRVLAADHPGAETAEFPYLGNYEQLARLELHALAGAGHRPETTRRLCFVGGGPLPLSAILLYRALGIRVTVVDRDREAVELSRRLVDRLVPAEQISVVLADAASPSDIARAVADCDVVVVAALVGPTRAQKRAALRAIGRSVEPGTHVLIRSADGLRTLLYPTVDISDVQDAGLAPELLLHPLGEVVNSVLVTRRR
ncbi:nicotianamine synthase [Krasilnikovia cinnamomea]|uniref:Nicotianamine synthase n=1 Tax=Krasilnikovia cinnamomea TaxID=349313 RepID=A0A4Q7ZRJ7_9ACTN|nr:nicotianamine synthase family protein [Krasilnikovia cinnamomea]RZU53454.1 nicotianamine synthase [Krasilnikovia cinnamomea]